MNKVLTLLAVSATLTISACTMDSNPTDLPPGKYEKSSTSVNSSGTKTQSQKSTEVEYDSNGNKRAVVKSKTTNDPKGLFNKSTDESETTYHQ